MSREFAEKMLDSMVDENGRCGERGLSPKQFAILSHYLEEGEWEYAGGWSGDYSYKRFYSTDFEGDIGKYHVVLNEFDHFNPRYTVVEIRPRPAEEVEAEMRREEFERKLREIGKFEHSEWVGEPKKRIDLELTLIRVYEYDRQAYGYSYGYHPETVHVYTLADADGNCIVWKSANFLSTEWYDGDDDWHCETAEPGDKVLMKATVKEHGEYRGVKQTVVNRPKVKEIVKPAI